MAKIFRNYNTLAEYEADTNKPSNVVCFIKDSKVIYVDGIQYSYKQLDYLPPATTEAEALEYMSKIIKNARKVGLIYVKPVPTIYWTGDSNTIKINSTTYTAEPNKATINGEEYYQMHPDKEFNNKFIFFARNTFTSLIFKNIDTSGVTDMDSIFSNLTKVTSLDVSCFNTSNVTNMHYMFAYATSITSLDLSNFNTDKVTTMAYMFYGCSALAFLDLSGFNTNKVTSVNSMFKNCTNLKTIRMVDCSQTTIDKIKAQLTKDSITGCTIVTE